jgi:hypothetical protein
VATLLEHTDQILAKFKSALSDRVLTAAETMAISGAIIEAASCTYAKMRDKSQFGALVTEAEALYDAKVQAAFFDIPRVPEFMEQAAVALGKMAIRPALEALAEKMDGVQ